MGLSSLSLVTMSAINGIVAVMLMIGPSGKTLTAAGVVHTEFVGQTGSEVQDEKLLIVIKLRGCLYV